MSGNSVLNSAKYSSNNTDEWYTTYETIEAEIQYYTEQFYGKLYYVIVMIRMSQIFVISL